MQLAWTFFLYFLSVGKMVFTKKELNADQQEQSSAQGWLDRKACYDGIGEFPAWPGAMRPPFFLAEEKGGDGGERREKKAAWPAARKNVCTLVFPLPLFPLSLALSERGEAECLRTHVRTHTHTHTTAGRLVGHGWWHALSRHSPPPSPHTLVVVLVFHVVSVQ